MIDALAAAHACGGRLVVVLASECMCRALAAEALTACSLIPYLLVGCRAEPRLDLV